MCFFIFLTFLKHMHIQCIHLFYNRCYNLYCTFLNADKSVIVYNRRKFRSQTSDNMDRWKAEQGREAERRERSEEKRVEEKE